MPLTAYFIGLRKLLLLGKHHLSLGRRRELAYLSNSCSPGINRSPGRGSQGFLATSRAERNCKAMRKRMEIASFRVSGIGAI